MNCGDNREITHFLSKCEGIVAYLGKDYAFRAPTWQLSLNPLSSERK